MAAGPQTMTRKKRNDAVTKIDRELLRKARHIANHKDIPVAEYLSEALRPVVEKDFSRFRKDIEKEDE